MTTPDLTKLCERLRAALEGVTPGPWTAERDPIHFDTLSTVTAGETGQRFPGQRMIVQVGGFAAMGEQEANTAFIALSHEAVPALLDALERQAAEIERLRGAAKRLLRAVGASKETPSDEMLDAIWATEAALTGEDAGGTG
jgi:hypothetical protein